MALTDLSSGGGGGTGSTGINGAKLASKANFARVAAQPTVGFFFVFSLFKSFISGTVCT